MIGEIRGTGFFPVPKRELSYLAALNNHGSDYHLCGFASIGTMQCNKK
jgi:hypothetical protein